MIHTSNYADMDIIPPDDGTTLYKQDGIKIVGKFVDEDSFRETAYCIFKMIQKEILLSYPANWKKMEIKK